MKSRISIEVDFENGNKPVIQIIRRESDDVRDNLISSFLQSLQTSSWLKIRWIQNWDYDRDKSEHFQRIFIETIPLKEIEAEAQIMLEQDRVNKSYPITQ